MSLVGSNSDSQNRELDYYPTPPEATEALLKVEKFDGIIWEPACGAGHMSKVLEDHGYEVLSTDIIDRGYGEGNHDFLTSPYRTANVVTNPPFILAEEFVRHALKKTHGKVCILAKLAFLEGGKRRLLFETTPLKSVYVFSKRVSLIRGQRVEPSVLDMAEKHENQVARQESSAFRRGSSHANGEKGSHGNSMIAFAWYCWEHGYTGKPELGWI